MHPFDGPREVLALIASLSVTVHGERFLRAAPSPLLDTGPLMPQALGEHRFAPCELDSHGPQACLRLPVDRAVRKPGLLRRPDACWTALRVSSSSAVELRVIDDVQRVSAVRCVPQWPSGPLRATSSTPRSLVGVACASPFSFSWAAHQKSETTGR